MGIEPEVPDWAASALATEQLMHCCLVASPIQECRQLKPGVLDLTSSTFFYTVPYCFLDSTINTLLLRLSQLNMHLSYHCLHLKTTLTLCLAHRLDLHETCSSCVGTLVLSLNVCHQSFSLPVHPIEFRPVTKITCNMLLLTLWHFWCYLYCSLTIEHPPPTLASTYKAHSLR